MSKKNTGKKNKKGSYVSFFFIAFLIVNSLMLGVNYSLSRGNRDSGVVQKIHAMYNDTEKETHYVELEPFITNLKPSNLSRNNYISVTFAVSIKGEKEAKEFEEKSASVRDSVITFLNKQTIADLLVPENEGIDEKDFLKEHVKESLDNLYPEGRSPIEEVLIVDLMLE